MHKIVKKLIGVLLVLILIPVAGLTENIKAEDVERKVFPYLQCFKDGTEPVEGEMALYFVNGGDIPYVSLTEYMAYLTNLFQDLEKGKIEYEVISIGEHIFSVRRKDNDSTMYVNTETEKIVFSRMNTFTSTVGNTSLVTALDTPDPVEYDLEALMNFAMSQENPDDPDVQAQIAAMVPSMEEDPYALFGVTGKPLNREGTIVTLDLSAYGIDLAEADGICYLPLQTMNDLFAGFEYLHIVFNGEKVLCGAYGTEFINRMYTAQPRQMSEEFAIFNSAEFCFLMDTMYGLKPEHDIDSFAGILAMNPDLDEKIHSTDPMKFDSGVTRLLFTYLDDSHSSIIASSWMSGDREEVTIASMMQNAGFSMLSKSNVESRLTEARDAAYPDGVPGYEEIGDTAFITFDTFECGSAEKREDYYHKESIEKPQDTIELMVYANRQIRREDSPVKNVVLDLSLNGGGNADAAVFVICFFLGRSPIALKDTLTGAETLITYKADINLNGKLLGDEEDGLLNGDYNLYCLTSPASFSCGNLVPAAFKASGLVTLVGQPTSGGSCVVLPCTSASGTLFQISGNRQLSIIRNGSFYNIDQGIEPDIVLTKPASFYDRTMLAEYLKNHK